ncbi:MAG: hypothetical protein WC781_05390 [Candidatus Pacearchaeota archaeon]|jgi:hypothetical protein
MSIEGYESIVHDIDKKRDVFFTFGFIKIYGSGFLMIILSFLLAIKIAGIEILPLTIKLTLIIIVAGLGLWLGVLGGTKYIVLLFNYWLSARKCDIYHKDLEWFLPIKSVESDVIYADDGSLTAIVQVYPIDYGIKSSDEQKAIIRRFEEFLNALNYDVKIIVRTVTLSLDDYLDDLKQFSIKADNPSLKRMQEEYFRFWRNFGKEKLIKNKLFYCVVSIKTTQFAGIQQTFQKTQGEEIDVFKTNEEREREINLRVNRLIERIHQMGLNCERLGTKKLISLVASMFEGTNEKELSYEYPIVLAAEDFSDYQGIKNEN